MSASEKKFSERQNELEEIGRSILVEDGMSGFSIERIATRSGYSRPTIYQHFRSKDDLLEAIASSSITIFHDLMTRSLACEGSPWHRAVAMILAYGQIAHFHPTHFNIGESMGNPWIARRLPESVRSRYKECVNMYIEGFTQIFELAKADGDLELRGGMEIRQLTFHSIATVVGVYSAIVKDRIIFRHAASQTQWIDAAQNLACLWEGYGWKKHETDLPEIYDVVMRECFPDYWVKAQTEILSAQVTLPGSAAGVSSERFSEQLAPAGQTP